MAKSILTLTIDNHEKEFFAAMHEVKVVEIEVEAMKAENQCRAAAGDSPAYGESAFREKAEAIRAIINETIKPIQAKNET